MVQTLFLGHKILLINLKQVTVVTKKVLINRLLIKRFINRKTGKTDDYL